jgi:hypothetical protein
MTTGSPKPYLGTADIFGGRQFNSIDYSGPTSYNNTGVGSTSGDTMSHRQFGFENTIQSFDGISIDQSGTYYVLPQPQQNGVTPWRLRWFTVGTGVEVANGVNLSTYTVKLAAIGY